MVELSKLLAHIRNKEEAYAVIFICVSLNLIVQLNEEKRRMKRKEKKIFLLSLDYANFRTLEELFNKVYIKIENLL